MLKTIINNILFTLSTFTTIHTKEVEYNNDNTKFTYFVLPFVGVVVGTISYLILVLFSFFIKDNYVLSIIVIVVNIIVTGGIHYDGLLDSLDAFKSYREKNEKLRIIKDSRVGAFAIIHFTVVILLFFISNYYIISSNNFKIILILPIVSRTFSLLLIYTNNLEENDMLEALWDKAYKKYYVIAFILYLLIVGALFFNELTLLVIIISLCYLMYYNKFFKKHFDNLSGDLCGYFIVCNELIASIFVALYIILF